MMRLTTRSRFSFSLIIENLFDHKYEIILRASTQSPLSVDSTVYTPQNPIYESTKLPSGITVLTESVIVPSTVQIGVFMNVGTRDECSESSGAMLSLKNTYLKTHINTSETINYGITQMSGGIFEMDYTRQNAYLKASCLSHDVIDVFGMVADCAFEPKNVVAASVGAYKNQESHKLEAHLGGNETFNDHIYNAAYGKKGLGMPFNGNKSNISYLSAAVIQKFQSSQVTPDRIVISASGVQSHKQFVDLVSDKLSSTLLPSQGTVREASKYTGGEVRNLNQSNITHIVLAFQGANIVNALPLLIAEEVLGNGRRTGRLQKNVLNKYVYVDNAQTINASHTDSGLFGLKLSGSAAHIIQAADILTVAINELNGLKTISQADFELAKSVLKGKVSRSNTCSAKRLEERVKSLYYIGKTNEHFAQQVDNITLAQVQEAVAAALKTPLTFVAQGGEVSHLESYEALSKHFA